MSDFDVMKRCLELQACETICEYPPMTPEEVKAAKESVSGMTDLLAGVPPCETPLHALIAKLEKQVINSEPPKYFHLEDDMLPPSAANPTEGTQEPEIKSGCVDAFRQAFNAESHLLEEISEMILAICRVDIPDAVHSTYLQDKKVFDAACERLKRRLGQ